MDLSFPLPTADDATPLPALDLARLLSVSAEWSAMDGETAAPARRPASDEWMAPTHGAFSAAMAARLTQWRQE